MDRLTELEVFAKIAEEESLTQAASALGISVSGVSRHLSALEDRLQVRLIQRTTRQMHLTLEGGRFAASAREILASLRDAEDSISLVAAEPRGTLRVGASLSFAMLHLMPVVGLFRARYPQVSVEVQSSNRYYDLVENGLDLAVRTRRVEVDSSVTIRKLAEVKRVLTASPDYIARHGMPETPEDLRQRSMLLYTLADDWERLHFCRDGEVTVLPVTGEVVSNDGQLLRQAALDGLGIMVQPAYVVYDDIQAGRLVRVLPEWELPRLTMNIAFPSRSHLPARTRLFIDTLVAYFADNRFEAQWAQV